MSPINGEEKKQLIQCLRDRAIILRDEAGDWEIAARMIDLLEAN